MLCGRPAVYHRDLPAEGLPVQKSSRRARYCQRRNKSPPPPAAAITAHETKTITSPLAYTEKVSLGPEKEVKELINAAKDHVFRGSNPKFVAKENTTKYRGTHTKAGLEQMIKENGGGQYTLKNKRTNPKTEVYEVCPEVRFNDGRIAVREGNKGVCTFFPDDWSQDKIIAEVEYASKNIIGKLSKWRNRYVGLSSDGKVRIIIQYDEYVKNGKMVKKITSYYPLYE